MQAVILAGGKGERLRAVAGGVPKPMVPVCGKPFLQYQIEYLGSLGFKEMLILAGFLGERIEEYFKDGKGFGADIRYSHEERLLGTAGALKNAEDKLDEEFLVLNGDTYLAFDYNELVKKFHRCGKMGIVAAYRGPDNTLSRNMVVDKSGMVAVYDKGAASGMTHVDAGVMAFKKGLLGLIPDGAVYSFEGGLFKTLIEKGELAAFSTGVKFYDIGSPEGLSMAEEILR